MQSVHCKSKREIFSERTPLLGVVRRAFGPEIASVWICIQLESISEFSGCKQKLTDRQYNELSSLIIESYGYLNMAEFMLFCRQFKRGDYGRFYSAVDPILIMDGLKKFDRERAEAYDRLQELAEAEALNTRYRNSQRIRERYRRRVPGAWTDTALLDFNQYRLMGYDQLSDDEFSKEYARIESGEITVPELPKILQGLINKNQ